MNENVATITLDEATVNYIDRKLDDSLHRALDGLSRMIETPGSFRSDNITEQSLQDLRDKMRRVQEKADK